MRHPLPGILLGILTLLLSAFWIGGESAAQKGGGSSFNPQFNVGLDRYWVGNPETVRIRSNLNRPDAYFDAWVQLTPPQWGLAADAGIPDGAMVGNSWISGNIGAGWGNNPPCNWQTGPNLNWLDATTNTTNYFTYNPATNPIYDPSWPGYDIMPSGLEQAIEQYPDFLNTMFPGITPRARYYAHTGTGAGEAVFQYLIFEPGTALPGLPPFDPGQGYPALIVEQDPTAPPEPGRTWDVCTNWQRNDDFWPWSGDNGSTAANEGGYVVRTNPSGWGWYPFTTFARARPDADGDGLENHLDTCPLDPNWDEDPRDGSGPDGDGLDSACDPFWDVTNDDEDGDGYPNRGDNCPLVANGLSEDNQADSDNDGIGNACDPNPGSVDGPGQEEWRDFWVEVSGDSDMDNWSDAFENIVGSNPWNPYSYPEHLRADPKACSDGVDNDLDGLVDGYDPGCDADEDGVVNVFDACPQNPEDHDGFQDADGCPDDDNDMDGIWDWAEGWTEHGVWCANIAEDQDSYRDWDGCPDPDNDQDGFPDSTDECPGTDWTAGPDGQADSGDEPVDPGTGLPILSREDYDGVLDTDGCHDSPGDDYDGDGWSDELEALSLGTNAARGCALTATANDEDPDPWPPDFDDNQIVNILDVIPVLPPYFGSSSGGPNYAQRRDLNADGIINILDVTKVLPPVFGSTCP